MDEKGYDDYRVELGAKIRPDTNSQVNKFIKAINKIPENRELRLRINKRNTLSKALNKELKAWNKFEQKATSGLNLFKGKRQLADIKGFYSKMRRTALAEMRKLYSELSSLTDENSENPKNLQKLTQALEEQRNQLDKNRQKQEEYQNTIKETKEQLENLGKIRQPNAIRADIMKIQSRLNQNLKRRSRDNVLGDVKSTQERNAAMTENNSRFYNAARDAALYRNRNFGQEGFKYFRELKKWTDWSAQSETLKNLDKQAKEVEGKFNLATMSYEKLLEEQTSKGAGKDTILDEDVEHAKNQVESLRAELAGFQKQKYAIQLEIDMRKQNKKQYEQFFAGSRDPNFMKQFGRAKTPSRDAFNVKLKQMETSYTSGIKKSTEQFMSPIDNEKLMADIQADETEVRRLQDELSKLNSGDFKKQVEELQAKLAEAEDNFKSISKEITSGENNEQKLNVALQETQALITEIERKADELQQDMQQNPQKTEMMNEALAKQQEQLDNSKKRLNVFARFSMRIFKRIGTNIVSQIASIMNPITNLRKAWSSWLDRFDNKAWSNTFEVIQYNLVSVIAPILEKIANLILKITAMANVLTKKFVGVDLFDKSAWSAEKLKKGVDSVTSSLDELHSVSDNPDDNNTIFDKGLDTDNLISSKTEQTIENFGNKAKKVWDGVTGFVKNHPILTAGLVGAWLTKGLWAPAVGGLIGKGIKHLFGGSQVATEAAAGAATTGSIWTTKFGTVIKKGLGVAAVAVGTHFTGKTAQHMKKYWNTMGTGEKVLYGLGNAASIATAAIGGFAVGGVPGAIGGAVIAGLNGLWKAGTTASNSIKSVKDATNDYNNTLQYSQELETNYAEGLLTLGQARDQLNYLEQQAGISAEELAKQVQNGSLSVDNMTTAQLQLYGAYLQTQQMEQQIQQMQEERIKVAKQLRDDTLELALANGEQSDSYDELVDKIHEYVTSGEMDMDEAKEYFSRAMSNMTLEEQRLFLQNLPDDLKSAASDWDNWSQETMDKANDMKGILTKAAEGWGIIFNKAGELLTGFFKNVGDTFSKIGEKVDSAKKKIASGWNNSGITKVGNFITGQGWQTNAEKEAKKKKLASYDVGTNYVPNDQLALVHQGEAIIPAKYNKGYQPQDNGLTVTISELRAELASLRNQMAQGINVSGEFKQRGNDLVAVVERGKNKNGNQPLSNPAYAR